MKILFVTRNYEHCGRPQLYYYARELSRQADVTLWGQDYPDHRPVKSISEITDETPNIIYYSCCATEPVGSFEWMRDVDIPKIALLHNGHNYVDNIVHRINWLGIDLVLYMSEADYVEEFKQRCACPFQLHPQSFEPTVFKDHGLPKDIEILTTGLTTPFYPLREIAQFRLRELRRDGYAGWVELPHPGYKYDFDVRGDEIRARGCKWGADLSRMLNRAKLTAFGGGKHRVFVKKYTEAMASKCMVMANMPYRGEVYGLEPGVHLVEYHDKHDFEANLRYYLEHDDERQRIVDAAYRLVMQRHTNKTRIGEFLDTCTRLLNGDFQ